MVSVLARDDLSKATATTPVNAHGFTVVRKGESETAQDVDTARDWTEQEVRLIVADYFAMLEAELQGEPYKKSEHRKALIPLLAGPPMAPSSSSTRTSAASW